jgi:hypothetical protein
MARHRPQPSTWGHLATLADLVDDWEEGPKVKLRWGYEGDGQWGTKHAGTSNTIEAIGVNTEGHCLCLDSG